MTTVTQKGIKHLARYFGVLALLILFGYRYTDSFYFMALLGPPYFLCYWLRVHGQFVTHWLPNEPFYNNFLLILPVTLIYFGLIGFQLKNLINERGKIRFLSTLALLAFLLYVHFLAFKELSLFWKGSAPLWSLANERLFH